MVKEGFGIAGSDLSIGADILIRAAISDGLADVSGKYFNNDSAPSCGASNPADVGAVMTAICKIASQALQSIGISVGST
ncbi:hypothetical protein [Aliiroseovarius marinus]|uniref:hypothetical protein n=1 Tax=Aliiroseovarius marinus TaxID=2500159 RepID=UPI002494A299|nr:hypothetical protein [Aliiroseovarius marinus]